MAWKNFVLEKGYNASAAITKFRCVKYTGNVEEVGPVSGITDQIAGVAQFSVTTAEITKGKGASVMLLGISEVEATGAIAVGAYCQLESDGRVSTASGSSGKRTVGKCVGTPSANSGDRISMLVIHNGALN